MGKKKNSEPKASATCIILHSAILLYITDWTGTVVELEFLYCQQLEKRSWPVLVFLLSEKHAQTGALVKIEKWVSVNVTVLHWRRSCKVLCTCCCCCTRGRGGETLVRLVVEGHAGWKQGQQTSGGSVIFNGWPVCVCVSMVVVKCDKQIGGQM